MKSFYDKYADNLFSQNGEDGIIKEVIKRIGSGNKLAVEFGACDGKYCSNTAMLVDEGWIRLLFDVHPGVREVMRATITPENVNSYVSPCQLLSIDIDGNDYNVWKAFTRRAAIVVIEINSSIHPSTLKPVSDTDHGTAYQPMVLLGIEKGYFLLVHTGNLIFILNEYRELFPEITGDGLTNWQEYFNTKWL